jgi:hypothetical protein
MTCADGKQHICEIHEPRLGGDFIVSTTPLADAAGGLFGTVHVAHDITGRKQAEDDLKRKNEDLNAAFEVIASKEQKLRDSLEHLSQVLIEKDVLLSPGQK